MPADAVPDSTMAEDTEAEVLLQDRTWIWCQVIGSVKTGTAVGAAGIR